jgi:rubrerythrin
LIEEAISRGRPLLGALQAALDIEQGLIEMEYYKVLAGDTDEVAAMFNRLAQDEKRHRMLVQEKLVSLTGRKS